MTSLVTLLRDGATPVRDPPIYWLGAAAPGAYGGETGGPELEFSSDGEVVGIDMDRTGAGAGVAYAWYRNGGVTGGPAGDLDGTRTPYKLTLPAGKSTANIIGVAIGNLDVTHVYYSDGTVSVGSTASPSTPLGAYTLAAGKSPSQVVGIAIDGSDRFTAFYSDLTWSHGASATDLASLGTGTFSLPSLPNQRVVSDVIDFAFGPLPGLGEVLYTWFKRPPAMVGTGPNNSPTIATTAAILESSAEYDVALFKLASPMTLNGTSSGFRRGLHFAAPYPGQAISCFGYGACAFPSQCLGSLTTADLTIDALIPPVDGYPERGNYSILANASNQFMTQGDSGGPCLSAFGSRTLVTGVHRTGGAGYATDTAVFNIRRWMIERALTAAGAADAPRVICHAQECFSAPDPFPANSATSTAYFSPCGTSGCFTWAANITAPSPAYVYIAGTAYSGTASPAGSACAPIAVSVSSGAAQISGLTSLRALCN